MIKMVLAHIHKISFLFSTNDYFYYVVPYSKNSPNHTQYNSCYITIT